MTGEEKWLSACKEEGQALYTLILMKDKIAECYIEKGELQNAIKEYKQALGILDVIEASEVWGKWRVQFRNSVKNIQQNAEG